MKKMIAYVAMSLDGLIAGENDDLSFLKIVEVEQEDYGYREFMMSIDTIIVGRKTYEKVISMDIDYILPDKTTYIITHTPFKAPPTVKFISNNLINTVRELKKLDGLSIFCDGGACIFNQLNQANLIDEIIVSIIPCTIGKGTRLFNKESIFKTLKLISSKTFSSGLVQLHYECSLEHIQQIE